jgi:iron(III) transport system substrate-binding protein
MRAFAFASCVVCLVILLAMTGPAAAGQVTVYSSRESEYVEPLLRVFESLTGHRVTFVYVGPDILPRLKKEGDQAKADLLIASDFSQLVYARQGGFTRATSIMALKDRIPDVYRDASGHWFALTRRARVLVVPANKEQLPTAEEPRYEDLADPAFKGRVCLDSGYHPDNIALVASIIAHDGEEEAENWLTSVKANLVGKPTGDDSDQIKAVAAGKCDVAVVNSYHVALMLKSKLPWAKAAAEGVRVLMPNIRDRGTHVTISGMALAAKARNVQEAELLMDFLTSRPAQKIFAQDNEEYPAREDEKPSALVAGWGALEAENIPLNHLALLFPTAVELIKRSRFDFGPE